MQALEELGANLNERINMLGITMNATDEGLLNYDKQLKNQFEQMHAQFTKAISEPGDVVHNAIHDREGRP